MLVGLSVLIGRVSTHSRPKAAGSFSISSRVLPISVSTHSRPKAAGSYPLIAPSEYPCFNTQPPEGGWRHLSYHNNINTGFNTQPPEGGWGVIFDYTRVFIVSTHSRPKAAGP